MSDIPESWRWTTVGEVAEDVVTGTTPSKKDPENYGDYLPFVKPPDLQDRPITEAQDSLSQRGSKLARVLSPESVLVSCIGTLGKTGINRTPVAFNQQINAVVFSQLTRPKYGLYYFQSAEARGRLSRKASATTIAIVNKSKFKTIPIPIAPLAEQHRIVAKIDELFTQLDAGVAALEKAKAQLRRYRQAVLKAAMEGELTREWREAHKGELEPASVLLDRILEERRAKWEAEQLAKMKAKGKVLKDDKWKATYKEPIPPCGSQSHELPQQWVWATLDQLSYHVTSGSRGWAKYYADTGALFVRVGNFNRLDTAIDLREPVFVSAPSGAEADRTRLQFGDLLITVTADVGMVGIVGERVLRWGEAYINQHVGLVRLAFTDIVSFVAYACASDHVQEQARSRQYGATKKGLGLEDLRSLQLPLPPLGEQNLVVGELERRLSVTGEMEKAIEQSLKRAERLRQSILKRAFEGKLMPQDPTDEPASVLLERIKAEKDSRESEKKNREKEPKKNTPEQLELI